MTDSAPLLGKDVFFTRQTANAGIVVDLYTPAGQKTAHWIRIRGVDSDAFREADAESNRRIIDIAQIKEEPKRREALKALQLEIIASLVVAWSFSESFTIKEVVDFLREAPQIADKIDAVARKRSLFFRTESQASAPGPDDNSD